VGLPSFRRSHLAAAATLALVAGLGLAGRAAAAPPDDVVIRYQLVPEFAGTEKAGGRIFLTLINRSTRPLADVTVRLADPSVGRLTGPVQESLALAAGETRQVEGEFVLVTAVLNGTRRLEWIMVYTDAQGFAQQQVVQGESLPGATMDADTRTAAH
jgi:hypothetical protein